MFKKLICKNGKVYLCTDLDEKIETINDINKIDVAKLDNDLEVCKNERNNINDAIEALKKKKKSYSIMAIICVLTFLSNLFLEQVLFIKLFCLITNAISVYLFYFKTLPSVNFRINGLQETLDYIPKKEKQILEEKEKKLKEPKYALVREGQEFDIPYDKDIPKIFEILCTYYTNKQRIVKEFSLFETFGMGDLFIHTLLNSLNRQNKDIMSEKGIREVADEIYTNIHKTKIKTK